MNEKGSGANLLFVLFVDHSKKHHTNKKFFTNENISGANLLLFPICLILSKVS